MSDATKDQKDILRKYLGQYFRARDRMEALERRRLRLQRELGEVPQEANALFSRQRESQALAIVEVTSIIALLPPESTEREILELRHIDCMDWQAIQRKVHLTRSPCFAYYNKGLEALLENKAVREALEKYEAQKRERNGGGH